MLFETDGMRGRVVIIEDREDTIEHFADSLQEAGIFVEKFMEAKPALRFLEKQGDTVDCLLTDFQLPDLDGLEILQIVQKASPRLPVVFVTGKGSVRIAIEAMKHGAFDYLEKPVERSDLLAAVQSAIERRESAGSAQTVSTDKMPEEMLIGRSSAMLGVYKLIGRVAAMDTSALIVGESGTGKELVARAIHENSSAASAGFLAINCAAIPEQLLESELFGYEKGAFTGASGTRTGLFESAMGGTVFLDEIGDMPRLLQSKILRVLQQKTVQRLGSHKEHPVKFRLIAATHQNLEQMVIEDRFREDLYHRLAGLKITLPPLAERAADIPLLTNYFLQLYAHEFKLQHAAIEKEALELLIKQSWPGNVRQLQNVIRTALLYSRNLGINRKAIEEALAQSERLETSASRDTIAMWISSRLSDINLRTENNLLASLAGEFEGQMLRQLNEKLDGNRTKMAHVLGISRLTLRRKLEALAISPRD